MQPILFHVMYTLDGNMLWVHVCFCVCVGGSSIWMYVYHWANWWILGAVSMIGHCSSECSCTAWSTWCCGWILVLAGSGSACAQCEWAWAHNSGHQCTSHMNATDSCVQWCIQRIWGELTRVVSWFSDTSYLSEESQKKYMFIIRDVTACPCNSTKKYETVLWN